MAFLNDAVLDAALAYITSNGSRVDICSQEPTSYAEATSTYTLGNKTGVTVGSAGDASPSGRKVTIPQITGGSVTDTDTATHWALTNGTNTLIATGALSASQAVTSGNTWSTSAGWDITLPDAT